MGRSEVTFTNSTGATISVAYMRWDHECQNLYGCEDDPWRVLGWIVLDPGQAQTRANPIEHRWFYFYAEDVNGGVWAGPYVTEVRSAQFEKCNCISLLIGPAVNPYHKVGFRELDTDTYSGVNFI